MLNLKQDNFLYRCVIFKILGAIYLYRHFKLKFVNSSKSRKFANGFAVKNYKMCNIFK